VENASISLLEAMNAGLAIITTNTTGCQETAGDSALLVSPRDVGGIKEALLKFIQDDNLREEFGQKARQRSIEHYSWDKIVNQYDQIYKGE